MIKTPTSQPVQLRRGDPVLLRVIAADTRSLIISMPLDELDASLRRLQNEYALRDRLDASWATVPLSLERHNDKVALVSSDPGGRPLREWCGMQWTRRNFLAIASRLLEAVRAMHEQSIVHQNLTPDDVLFDNATERLALSGFGYAARIGTPLQSENSTAYAYMAPEVMGGLTKTAETAQDLYAVGCIFYELLTGHPPFNELDPLSWMHAHLARQPDPLEKVRPDLPRAVIDVVMRLLKKQSERRYVSASETHRDIKVCEAMDFGQLRKAAAHARLLHNIASDQRTDAPYGRDEPIAMLKAAFESTLAGGRAGGVFISGRAGIGKTALLNAFHREIDSRCIMFSMTKSERSTQEVPFAALTAILTGLLRAVLSAPEADFKASQRLLQETLGNGGGLLARLIPDLSAVIGDIPSPALPAKREREILLQAAVNFVCTCIRPGSPVVLFFDDLQWTDVETIEVIRLLLDKSAIYGILVVGTYRDDEVDISHPLMTMVIQPLATLAKLKLEPLGIGDLVRLVRDRYRCDDTDAVALAQLLKLKTLGNPFFARQFLTDLERDGLVSISSGSVGRRWNLELIRSRDFTDNVTELLVQRLKTLPASSLPVLRILACIGTRASIAKLTCASGLAPKQIRATLKSAVQLDCVRADGDDYLFWHDRVQEAVYATMTESERASAHLEIARRLEKSFAQGNSEHDLFSVVRQINLSTNAVSCPLERRQFARINMAAADMARQMTANASARNYLVAGVAFLGTDNWDGLARRMTYMLAECEFLTNELESAERRLLSLASANIEPALGAEVTRLQAALYTTMDRPDIAMEVGFNFLASIGIDVPRRPTDEDVRAAYERLGVALDGRTPASLLDHPTVTDPLRKGTLDVLADLIPPALFIDVNLMDMLVLTMAIESIKHGHTDSCCYAYVTLMFVYGTRFNDFEMGYDFAKLAINLIDLRGMASYKARTYIGFGLYILPWHGRLRDGEHYIREAFDVAIRTGDMTFAVYCRRNLVSIAIVSGMPLADMRGEVLRALDFAVSAQFQLVVDAIRAQIALVHAFAGPEMELPESDGAHHVGFEVDINTYPFSSSVGTIAEFSFWTHRMQVCVAFGDIAGALISEGRGRPISWSSRAFVEIADFHFYGALARAAALRICPESERCDHARAFGEHRKKLENWAKKCPSNFGGRASLVAAEEAWLRGQDVASVGRMYDAAIAHARDQGVPQDEGLANELAANFYRHHGLVTIARSYLQYARSCYAMWGAYVKVRQLNSDPLLNADLPSNLNAGKADPVGALQLDTIAVVKASNALSSEIVTERVVQTLMATAVEMAGAQSGVLILVSNTGMQIAARATPEESQVKVDITPLALESEKLPLSLIQHVSRTLRTVVLADASVDQTFSRDTYFRFRMPRSIFCMPLVRQTRLVAILYLENDLTPGAFVSSRTGILEVLASQAAIALENARLYADLLEESHQRALAQDALRNTQAEFERAARLTTMGELVASIVHEVTQPINAIGTSAGAALRWLNRKVPDLSEAKEMLQQIADDSARAKSVIHGIRALARKSSPVVECFDVNEAIREVLALARAQCHEVCVELNDALTEESYQMFGDRVQIQQVALNLLMNALEAVVYNDGRRPILKIGTSVSADEMIEVYVTDNGKGLDGDALSRIFEPFFTTKPNGMGMGLVICRSIVEAHGGRLHAISNCESGTTFRFTLAIHPAVKI
jgi:predicted ATPase/signal transduction histidine kinase